MDVPRQLGVYLLHQVEQITQHLQHVHPFGPQPRLGRHQSLADRRHTLTQPLNPFLHVAAHRGVVLLPHHQIQVAPGRLVQIVHRREARRAARQQLERAQRLDRLDPTHRFS